MGATQIAEEQKLGKRLVRGHPMLEAEVVYCVQHEFCLTPMDFLAHRTRLAFLDHAAAEEVCGFGVDRGLVLQLRVHT